MALDALCGPPNVASCFLAIGPEPESWFGESLRNGPTATLKFKLISETQCSLCLRIAQQKFSSHNCLFELSCFIVRNLM